MTRYLFGGQAADLVVTEDAANDDALIVAPAVVVDFYDEPGGVLQDDFLLWGGIDYDDPATEIETDAAGVLPAFKGPDGVQILYLVDGRVLLPRDSVIASADDITDGASKVMMTTAERTKLSGVATSATANSADATLLARANHTGSQAISTVTSLQAALDEREPVVRWDSGTNTWAARPDPADAPFVVFKSTDDDAATAPNDPDLQVGDEWHRIRSA